MIRMEIALILILAFVAGIYFSARRRQTALHKTFSALLIVVFVHRMFDAATIYTVNHLAQVPLVLNDVLHRLFVGTMALVLFFFYQYIAILVEEETGMKRTLDLPARIFLVISEVGAMTLPITYIETPDGNYSAGLYAYVSYVSVAVYLILCSWLLLANWKRMDNKKKFAIGMALIFEFTICFLQGLHHTWLISGMGITLMTLAFYLTLENPDALRAELTEQKMSMLYLKSQVNPHFLYNTLDTIRSQAELDGDKKVAKLLMRRVDFFRLSVKVDRSMVTLDDELELVEAYMELMCYRYPELFCDYDIDPDLGAVQVPNFILQPLVENAIFHGLEPKGGHGSVLLDISTDPDTGAVLLRITDDGVGMPPEQVAHLLDEPAEGAEKAEKFRHVGLWNVNRRIRYSFGEGYGLTIESEEDVGTEVTIRLPYQQKGDTHAADITGG